MHMESEVFFDEGYVFGEACTGFKRINIACPTDVMVEGLERVRDTIRRLGK